MQFTTVLALLVAAVGIKAAPSQVISERAGSIPLSIYRGRGCNDPPFPTKPVTTVNVPTDGSCFPIPLISGTTDSGRIDVPGSLPAGCKLQAWFDTTCTSVNTFNYTITNDCKGFGEDGKFIRSAKAVGTCA